ncbi:MAG TPA: hypothetical protein P5301_00440 [Bacteroidales bacterium]|jgi:hypothetical protein|nr:hypothetical protein [Bacteroidales bacterium]HQL12013.1 hypothetical protein [bacterium]HRR51927.1 hypothetical protein [Bacteroidales bacterium]
MARNENSEDLLREAIIETKKLKKASIANTKDILFKSLSEDLKKKLNE